MMMHHKIYCSIKKRRILALKKPLKFRFTITKNSLQVHQALISIDHLRKCDHFEESSILYSEKLRERDGNLNWWQ